MNESGVGPHIARQSGGLMIDGLLRQFIVPFLNAVALAPEPSGLPGQARHELEARLKSTTATWPSIN